MLMMPLHILGIWLRGPARAGDPDPGDPPAEVVVLDESWVVESAEVVRTEVIRVESVRVG